MGRAAGDSGRYSVHPYLRDRWERMGRKLSFTARTEGEWKIWRRDLLRVLRRLTGSETMISCPLNPMITETKEFDDYTRQRVEIETETGVVMPLFALIPKKGRPPFPVVIAPHGHGGGGKAAVAGCREQPEIAKAIDHYNYAYGVSFAKAGFIAFCPDARGFGERQEQAARGNILDSSCRFINNMAYPLGQTITGMWAWDLSRLVDYVQTRSDCRPDRIGCAGLSGGGLQTLWAAAFDERISCAVISGYMYGYRDSLLDLHQNCSCNYVPRLYEYADMGDIAATIAPRPILIETGDKDSLNGARGVANVTSQVDMIRASYRVRNAENKVFHDVFDGEHRWNGVHALPWLEKWLK